MYEHKNTRREGDMNEERVPKARVSTTVPEPLMMTLRHHLLDRKQTFAAWLEGQMKFYLDAQSRAERKKEDAA